MKSSIFPAFTVMRFTYVREADGKPNQQRAFLGCFHDPEAAFERAKTEAWQALCVLSRAPEGMPSNESWELAVCGTEWGYDLCRNGRVVDRFWVHDRDSLRLAGERMP
ncbi:MAG: hypothetical protein NTU80_09335 [Verrucomicrobia bacterium]|nr:hypothetical protein [Verrucomicrobiota bacterium]